MYHMLCSPCLFKVACAFDGVSSQRGCHEPVALELRDAEKLYYAPWGDRLRGWLPTSERS